MSDDRTTAYDAFGGGVTTTAPRDRAEARAVFGQTMGLVAVTCAFAALGAYLGQDLSRGAGWAMFFVAIIGLLGLNAAVAYSERLGITVLFVVGLALGMMIGPMVAYYADANPAVVYEAAGATALFIGGLGAVGYATRRDLSHWARALFFALLGLIGFGLVAIFVNIPNERVIWAVLGLGVFGLYTVFDFNKLRRAGMESSVPIAAGIFLDVVNVFQFFLILLGGGSRN